MNRFNLLVASTFAAVLTSCASKAMNPDIEQTTTLTTVINEASRYDGQKVVLSGYLTSERDSFLLFENLTDVAMRNDRRSLWLEFTDIEIPPAHLERQHVEVHGRFRKSDQGHVDLWSGSLIVTEVNKK